MAWYAELKRRGWYCINKWNAIAWYKKCLYDAWWNSLSEEEMAVVERNRELAAKRREREAKEAVSRLMGITAMMSGLCERTGRGYRF